VRAVYPTIICHLDTGVTQENLVSHLEAGRPYSILLTSYYKYQEMVTLYNASTDINTYSHKVNYDYESTNSSIKIKNHSIDALTKNK
jgi:hypothetical protein